MNSINDFLLNNSKMLVLIFLGLTILLRFNNRSFDRLHKGLDTIQFQSTKIFAAPELVDTEVFNEIISSIKSHDIKRVKLRYFWFFILDFFWALTLLATIYILSKAIGEHKGILKGLIIVGILAYLTDVIENLTYLFQPAFLVPYLEYVNLLKLVLYATCLLYFLFFVLRRLIKGREKPELTQN